MIKKQKIKTKIVLENLKAGSNFILKNWQYYKRIKD